MSTIFVTQPGYAVRISDDVPTGNVLEIGGETPLVTAGGGSFAQHKALVTGISMEFGSGIQVMHSLQQLIYVFSFGERIGTITVAGLTFSKTCEPGADNISGAEKILKYYNDTSVSKTGKMYPITIGTSVHGRLRGFLRGVRLGLVNPELQISEFALMFNGFRG